MPAGGHSTLSEPESGRWHPAVLDLVEAVDELAQERRHLYISQDIPCEVVLRLDNLQVVNAFNDGPSRYEYDWLRRNDRDMAVLAWEMDEARRARGFGGLRAVHQLGHPERRKKVSEYDQHEHMNVKVDTLTHRLTDSMPLYVSFKRQARQQTQLWYEPLYEENVGHGTLHEVTGDVYRHIAKSALRRTSIRRLQRSEGDFQANFVVGATGRTPSERRSSFVTKLMHDNLPTEARIAMWGGVEAGSVLCACGDRLVWSDRKELGSLQWHCLACTSSQETGVRKRWRAFVRSAVAKAVRDPVVVDVIVDCWTHRTDGTIHTAFSDQDKGWVPPTLRQLGDVGSWEFDPSGVAPSFDSRVLRDQDTESGESDSGEESARCMANTVVTANGVFKHDKDWNGIESSTRPELAAARLLHVARQRTDTSRWWTMRWPVDAISLLSRAGSLDTAKTYELMRTLRQLANTFMRELWS